VAGSGRRRIRITSSIHSAAATIFVVRLATVCNVNLDVASGYSVSAGEG